MLGLDIDNHQNDWDEIRPNILASYHASLHETTGFSSNFLKFQRKTKILCTGDLLNVDLRVRPAELKP